jgi:hypothetical protein
MIRHLLIFVLAAGLGGMLALGVRSALHRPYAEPAAPAAPQHEHVPPAKPAEPQHGHSGVPVKKPVNTICAICGMDADPKLTATYREQVIAFGCDKCPPKFAKDPERYGPYFLRNEEAP